MLFWVGVAVVAALVVLLGWWTSGRTGSEKAPGADYDAMKAEAERSMMVNRMKGTGGAGGL